MALPQTALHVACQHGQLGAVTRLLSLGADVNLPAHGGARPTTIVAVRLFTILIHLPTRARPAFSTREIASLVT